ncbi:MAG: SDR family NAD(P)-dependent oxidoreductase [Bacteroidales bacterium]|nr:SDR family NAD(P)-dependent oxidoreductase [Bacteroidales bacterium]
MEIKKENQYTGLELAIIGLSCKFPGSKNVQEFWSNLYKGKETISFFTEKELLDEGISERLIENDNYIKASGILADKGCFDSRFFGYKPEEAKLMNPQLRLLHESVWNALEDAGYDPSIYKGKIGLFAGAAKNYNWETGSMLRSNQEALQGNISKYLYNVNFMCSRVAYNLNLKGPAVFVDTACSSSFVAVHLAGNSLLLGECDIAIAGGVRLFEHVKDGYMYQPGMIHSKDGHCRAFDVNANGAVPGEGIGLVVIKKLKKALEDGDNIHAIIKGSAINNDGNRKIGYTAPSINGQVDVIKKALKRAKVDPSTISYIEGHGTGTVLGDSIEMQSLEEVFRNNSDKKLGLGSVKTNIGHLDFAAGIASLIKAVLVLKNKKITPTLHFKSLNTNVAHDKFPFFVNNQLTEFNDHKSVLRAGVSSFGIGGTNSHVILEEAPNKDLTINEEENKLLLLSAKTSDALLQRKSDLLSFLKLNNEICFDDLIYTLQIGRKSLKHRTALVCKNVREAIDMLSSPQNGDEIHEIVNSECKQIVFMFSGQGSQYANMGKQLYGENKFFRDKMDECFEIASNYLDENLKDILFTTEVDKDKKNQINNTNYTHPLLFIFEYSLASWLIELGIRPDFMIGHSLGEYVAACLSGALNLEDAIRLVIQRGRLIWSMPKGSMLSVTMSEQEADQYLSTEIDLAAVNAHNLCVLSGRTDAIKVLEQELKDKGIVCRELITSHAFHSHMMNPILKEFEREIDGVHFGEIKIPFVSNLTGNFVTSAEISSSNYWIKHLRQTVRYNNGIKSLINKPKTLFIEVGPGKTLAGLTQYANIDNSKGNKVLTTVRNEKHLEDDYKYFLKSLAQIWNSGINLNWTKTFNNTPKRISIPGYPFERIKYPINQSEFVNKYILTANSNRNQNVNEWIYENSWKRKSLIVNENKFVNSKVSILFVDDNELCRVVVDAFKKREQQIIFVKKGEKYSKDEKGEYIINPLNQNEYKNLFDDLVSNKQELKHIIYLWDLNYENKYLSKENKKSETYTYRFGSILNILKSLIYTGEFNDSKFISVSNNAFSVTGSETLNPKHSTQVALLKVFRQENPLRQAFNIDLSLNESNVIENVSLLLQELDNNSEVNVCLRNGMRWIPDYIRQEIPKEYKDLRSFKKEGVYIIIGGLGNLGNELSKYLITNYKSKLIITGRSNFENSEPKNNNISQTNDLNDRKYQNYKTLIENNNDVTYIACDVSNTNDLLSVGEFAIEKYGNIDGVIHAGGIGGGVNSKLIKDLTISDIEAQFSAKVNGLISTNKLIEKYNINLCIITSSLSSVLGGLGFGAYASANSFIDQYIDYLEVLNRQTNWVNINFDGISFVNDKKDATRGMISVKELPIIFEYALKLNKGSRISRFVISTTDLYGRIEKWITNNQRIESDKADSNDEKQCLLERPILSVNYIEAKSSIEKLVTSIWKVVLGLEEIGIDDDFYELGGDSLKAMTIIGKINKQFNTEHPLTEFLKSPTVRNIARYIDSKEKTEFKEIPFAEKKEYYKQSDVQKRLYTEQQFNPNSTAYNIPNIIKLSEKTTKLQVENIFNRLISRHEGLRTHFDIHDGIAIQKISINSKYKIEEGFINEEGLKDEMENFIKPFNLSSEPLLRVKYIKTNRKNVYLLTDIHHIIYDWVSQKLLNDEFSKLSNGENLLRAVYSYKDYSEWQNGTLFQDKKKKQEEYWAKRFLGELPNLNLPQDYYPDKKSNEGARKTLWLSKSEINNIKNISRRYELTLHTSLLSMFGVLFSKICNQSDLIIGTVVNGRRNGELDKVFGMFVNTLAIRMNVDGQLLINDYFKKIKEYISNDFLNQEYQFGDLVEMVGNKRRINETPLFRVMFNLMTSSLESNDIKNNTIDNKYSNDTANFDLIFKVVDYGKDISIDLIYRTDFFKHQTIEFFLTYLKQIFQGFGKDDQLQIKDFKLHSDEIFNNNLSEAEGLNCDVEFDDKMNFVDLIQKSDLKELANVIKQRKKNNFKNIRPLEKKNYYPMSYNQERLYLIWQLQKDGLAYNIPRLYKITGNIEIAKIKTVFKTIVNRHESLKTNFPVIDGQPVQYIKKEFEFEVEEVFGNNQDEICLVNDFVRPFDLNNGQLIKVRIVKIAAQKVLLLIDTHQIIADGIFSTILMKEFIELYNGNALSPQKYQFKDYSECMRVREVSDKQLDYWKELLIEDAGVPKLTFDFEANEKYVFKGGAVTFDLDRSQEEKIVSIANQNSISTYTFLFTIFNLFLGKICNQRTIIVSTPFVGRKEIALENVIGMFINNLLVKTHIDNKLSFSELLAQVNDNVLRTFDNGDFPLHEILSQLNINNKKVNELFEIAFVFNNIEYDNKQINNINVELINGDSNNSKHYLELHVLKSDRLKFVFKYNKMLFKKDSITMFVEFFKNIVDSICMDQDVLIQDIKILGEHSSKSQINDFNFTI